MTAVETLSTGDNSLTNDRPIYIDNLEVTSDETYTPAKSGGGTLKILSFYNNTDGATVKGTISSGVITCGNGQSLSDEDCMLTYTYV